MSEATGTCGCGKSTSSCDSPAKSSGTSTSDSSSGSSTGTSVSASGIQNGKGDAPRSISPLFRANYDEIRWESGSSKRAPGVRYVKSY